MRQNNSWLRDRAGKPHHARQAGVLIIPSCIPSQPFSIPEDPKSENFPGLVVPTLGLTWKTTHTASQSQWSSLSSVYPANVIIKKRPSLTCVFKFVSIQRVPRGKFFLSLAEWTTVQELGSKVKWKYGNKQKASSHPASQEAVVVKNPTCQCR